MPICKRCGEEVDSVSTRGICQHCGIKAMHDAVEQMAAHTGPYYEKWLSSRKKAVAAYKKKMVKAIKNYDEAFGDLEHLATPVGQAEVLIRMGQLTYELGKDYLDDDEDEEDR